MSISNHISELERKHRKLEQELEALRQVFGVKDSEIAEKKRRKLKIKDELNRLAS